MSASPSEYDPDSILNLAECDIQVDYDKMFRAVWAFEAKYSSMLQLTQKLKSKAEEKDSQISLMTIQQQEEMTLLAAQHQEQVALLIAEHQKQIADRVPRETFYRQMARTRSAVYQMRQMDDAAQRYEGWNRNLKLDLQKLEARLANTDEVQELRDEIRDLSLQLDASKTELATAKARFDTGDLRKEREDKRRLRRLLCAKEKDLKQARHLAEELKHAQINLARAQHLQCDICRENIKNRVLICGHAYCAECLQEMFMGVDEVDCASCRRRVKQSDIWKIYLPEKPLLLDEDDLVGDVERTALPIQGGEEMDVVDLTENVAEE